MTEYDENEEVLKETAFAFDGDRVIAEYEDEELAREFVYGNGIDEVLVMDVDEDEDGSCVGTLDSRYFYHQDTLDSVYGITDEDGDVVEAYEYNPYGEHITITDGDSDGEVDFDSSDNREFLGASPIGNPYMFTGRRFMPESVVDHPVLGKTGLMYYRNRFYDPRLGRFLSRDPIGYAGGVNLYAYVGNQPTYWTDPYGLQSFLDEVKGCVNSAKKDINKLTKYAEQKIREQASGGGLGMPPMPGTPAHALQEAAGAAMDFLPNGDDITATAEGALEAAEGLVKTVEEFQSGTVVEDLATEEQIREKQVKQAAIVGGALAAWIIAEIKSRGGEGLEDEICTEGDCEGAEEGDRYRRDTWKEGDNPLDNLESLEHYERGAQRERREKKKSPEWEGGTLPKQQKVTKEKSKQRTKRPRWWEDLW